MIRIYCLTVSKISLLLEIIKNLFTAGTATDAPTTNGQTTVTFEMTFVGPVTNEELEFMKSSLANVLPVKKSDISTAFKITLSKQRLVVVTIKTTPEKANELISIIESNDFVTDFNKEKLVPKPLRSISTPVCEGCSK